MNPRNMEELRNLTLKDAVVAVTADDSAIDNTLIKHARATGRKSFLLSFRQNSNVRSGSIIEDSVAYRQFFTLDDIINRVSSGTSSEPEEVKSTFGYFLLLYSLGVARAESMAASNLVLPDNIFPAGVNNLGHFYNVLQNLTNEGTSRDTNIAVKLLLTEKPKLHYGKRYLSPDKVAEDLGIKADDLCIVYLPMLKNFGASGLLRDDVQINAQNTKIEYVPFRNTVLLAIAIMRAELVGAKYVAIGANHDDTLAPDGTPQYVKAINEVIQAVDGQVPSVIAPLLGFGGKPEIVRTGLDLGVNFSHTWSCHAYVPPPEVGLDAKSCGTCGNCATRYSAFEMLGLKDPVGYKEIPKLRTKWAGPQG